MSSSRPPQATATGSAPASTPVVPGERRLLPGVVAVTVLSLVGSVLAVAGGLSDDWWHAVGPTGRLSVPLPMNAALILLALAAAGRRRRLALAAAVALGLACTTAVVSGFFDGGYRAGLSPVERVMQIALVLGLVAVAMLALHHVARLVRPASVRPDPR